jgi:hypothetical protein
MWRFGCRCVPALLCAALLLLAAIAVMAPAQAPAGAQTESGAAIVMDGQVSGCDGDVAGAQIGCCGSNHCATPSAALSGAVVIPDQGEGVLPHRLIDVTNPKTRTVGAAFKPPRNIA